MSKVVKFEALVVKGGIRQVFFVDAVSAEEAREKIEELNKDSEFKIVYLVTTPLYGTDPVARKVPTEAVEEAVEAEAVEEPTEAVEPPVVVEAEVFEAVEVEEPIKEVELAEEPAEEAKPKKSKAKKA